MVGLMVAGVVGVVCFGEGLPEVRPVGKIDALVPVDDGFFGWNAVRHDDLLVVMQRRGGVPGSSMFRGSLAAFDLSDPTRPVEMWSKESPWYPKSESGYISWDGVQLAATDRVLAVGMPYTHLGTVGQAGLVQLLDPETGRLLGEIIPPTYGDGGTHDRFGYSIDVQDDRLLVGMTRNSHVGFLTGAAFLYDISEPRHPELLHSFYPEPGTPDWSQFGWSVAMDGDMVVISNPQDYEDGGPRSGEVYVFDAVSGERLALLQPEPNTGFDSFANHVDIDNGLIVVNAVTDEVSGPGALGAIYAFDATSFELLSVNRPDPGSGESMGWVAVLEGSVVRNLQGTMAYPNGLAKTWDYSDPRLPVRIARHLHTDAATDPYLEQPSVLTVGIASYDGVEENQGAVLIFPAGPCSKADLAVPFEVLDWFDVSAFVGAMGAGDLERADLAEPVGVLDFWDLRAFLGAFGAGCGGG